MFGDNLREAKGFDNHVLVSKLAAATKASLIGRIPAVAKRRTGAIDAVLRNFAAVMERADTFIDPMGYALIDWDIVGTLENNEKRSIQFTLNSTLLTIMGHTLEDLPLVTMVTMEFEPVEGRSGFVPVGPAQKRTEEENEAAGERWDRWEQHPIGALFNHLLLQCSMTESIQLIGTNDRTEPTTWFFKYSKDGKTECFYVELDLEQLDDELTLVMGK